ncbi:MAG: ATP-dependent zinc metalloprotease FtsH [Muribaculaceae bacterium]
MDNKKKQFKGFRFSIFWMYAIIGMVLMGLFYFNDSSAEKPMNWQPDFKKLLVEGNVKHMWVYAGDNKLEAELTEASAKQVFKDMAKVNYSKARVVVQVPHNVFEDQMKSIPYTGILEYESGSGIAGFLWSFGPVILLIVFWFILMRRMSRGGGDGSGGVFNIGKTKAQLFDKEKGTNVTFKDVAGLQEAKTEVEEIVEFLKNPQKFTNLGGKIPKGALLVGPPGTGKTLLAKAVAGEANVPFFSLSGSDFVEMFVGVGASRVRDLFKKAKDKAPCIIFIDEIDAVGRARGKNPNMGSNDERENTLNQLLTEMDGFGTNSGIIVLAATNRVDILDKALLRAGRFDRQIYVDLPDLNDRKEIFMVHLRDVKIAPDVDVDLLSRQTPGFSGADIANVCNEAALIAARRSKEFVEKQDFMDAVDRIVGGLEKRSKITTEEERESIATHEAGHATISWHLKYANPLIKVTIVPRGKALGAAWYLPEERQITPEQALLDEICSLLGGRAAEDLFLGCVSTGALNDLERASKQAYAIVAYYGMSKSLPNVSYYDSTGQDYMFAKPYSEDRARMIDAEVTRVLSEQYERAKQILKEYEGGHHQLRDLLLTREVIFTEDVEHIFGKRKWASRADEIIKANEEKERQRSIAAGDADKSETDSLSDPTTLPLLRPCQKKKNNS